MINASPYKPNKPLYPWLVRIKRTTTYKPDLEGAMENVFSGGSIINNRFILTCANCVCRTDPDTQKPWTRNTLCSKSIHANQIGNIWKENETPLIPHNGANSYKIWSYDAKKHSRPHWVESWSSNKRMLAVVHSKSKMDVGFLKILQEDNYFTIGPKMLGTLCLPTINTFKTDVEATIAGWGSRFEETDTFPNTTTCLTNQIGPDKFVPCVSRDDNSLSQPNRFCYDLPEPEELPVVSVKNGTNFFKPWAGNTLRNRTHDVICAEYFKKAKDAVIDKGHDWDDFASNVQRIKVFDKDSGDLDSLCHIRSSYTDYGMCKTGDGPLQYGMCSRSCTLNDARLIDEDMMLRKDYTYEEMQVRLFHDDPSKYIIQKSHS